MKERTLGHRIRLFLFVKLPLAFIGLTLLWVLILKWVPVAVTPLMIQRKIEYKDDPSFKTRKKWVSYKKMSPELAKAAIASEDNRFQTHKGFDKEAIKEALEEHKQGRPLRGASTISQQTAKNVFCTHSRTYVRKAFEAYFTTLIELLWSKERIMEVYLNVAEMGKGIYGAEAAARYYWGHSAQKVTQWEACLLVSCLPSPLTRNPKAPSSFVSGRAGQIAYLEKLLVYPDWVYHKKPQKTETKEKGSALPKKK